ncbi:uncharacterized protein [Rutidosis leptorrhynchoides]|uniref:uncharacterized protein n=1 Tax=Rutidosis leptorrhynchoides TaxID=125765 RepID=UPI003A9A3BA6
MQLMGLRGSCLKEMNQKTFRPKKSAPSGSKGAQLRKHIDATLGSGNLQEAVRLLPGEDINEWLAVNRGDFMKGQAGAAAPSGFAIFCVNFLDISTLLRWIFFALKPTYYAQKPSNFAQKSSNFAPKPSNFAQNLHFLAPKPPFFVTKPPYFAQKICYGFTFFLLLSVKKNPGTAINISFSLFCV